MKKRPFHDPDAPDGGALVASPQTLEDLELIERRFREITAAEADLVAALARVRARGDGEVAVGMPLDQHLRWSTNRHGAVITGLGNVVDVIDQLPTVRAALEAQDICLDQAIAVARHAAGVSRDLRRSLDLALSEEESWVRWEPLSIEANVARLLEELDPRRPEERERTAGRRQFLHVQPELDGQAVKFWGRYEGLGAAKLLASIDEASDDPKSGVARGPQRAAGLLRILDGWAAGLYRRAGDGADVTGGTGGTDPKIGPFPAIGSDPADTRDHNRTRGIPTTSEHPTDGAKPNVVIHLLVEEDHASRGVAAQVLSATRGFAPRLTADALGKLTDDNPNVTTITTFTREGVPVAVKGRAGHAIDDPDGLSEDSVRELVRLRQGGICAAPGCSNPIDDYHHIMWRIRGGRDDPSNRSGLCKRCHHRVAHDRGWTIAIEPDGATAWQRHRTTITVPPRHRRILRPPKNGPPDHADDTQIFYDAYGDPLPF